jgi:putative flippase GtrA
MWVFAKYLMVGAVNTIAGSAVIVFCLEILASKWLVFRDSAPNKGARS